MRIVIPIVGVIVVLLVGLKMAWRVNENAEATMKPVVETVAFDKESEFIYFEFQVAGCTFTVPPEKSSSKITRSKSSDGKYSYISDSLTVEIDGLHLTVDGKKYGTFADGDKVDFRTKGKVLVNGAERKPVAD